jgi:3-phenylpropionate/trans-cinnamate dioxygenase ferredoxin subunit
MITATPAWHSRAAPAEQAAPAAALDGGIGGLEEPLPSDRHGRWAIGKPLEEAGRHDRLESLRPRAQQPPGDAGRQPTPGKEKPMSWIPVCAADDIEPEDVIRVDHGGRTFAVYRSPDDLYYATDGLCTHEQVHLADGLVMDSIIECPKHNGRFDYRTGEAKGAPACVDLHTYPVRIEAGKVLLDI